MNKANGGDDKNNKISILESLDEGEKESEKAGLKLNI